MGADGKAGSPNSNVAIDAYGFALHYFQSDANGRFDYKPIATGKKPFANPAISSGVNPLELYNGNIGAMSVNIPQLGNALLYNYKYDQLNRLVKTYTYTGLRATTNSWSKTATDEYREEVKYDPNGNIITYDRNGSASRLAMDKMTYSYKPATNQLDKVADIAPDVAEEEDIKQGQSNGNYQYDAIGNLIADTQEGITGINWNVYGKISSIQKSTGDISYAYDAAGNRISKTVGGKTTVYVRDASGNVMSVYESVSNSMPLQKE